MIITVFATPKFSLQKIKAFIACLCEGNIRWGVSRLSHANAVSEILVGENVSDGSQIITCIGLATSVLRQEM
jgi:hypothetical protein